MYIKPPGPSGSILLLFLQQELNKICHPVCLETSWDCFQQETGCEPSPAPHYCQSGTKHLWSHHRLETSIDFYEDRTWTPRMKSLERTTASADANEALPASKQPRARALCRPHGSRFLFELYTTGSFVLILLFCGKTATNLSEMTAKNCVGVRH